MASCIYSFIRFGVPTIMYGMSPGAISEPQIMVLEVVPIATRNSPSAMGDPQPATPISPSTDSAHCILVAAAILNRIHRANSDEHLLTAHHPNDHSRSRSPTATAMPVSTTNSGYRTDPVEILSDTETIRSDQRCQQSSITAASATGHRPPSASAIDQRKFSGIFSSKNLRNSSDPADFVSPNYYGQLVKTDLQTFKLPSSRWKWENDWMIRTEFDGQPTHEGWVYSSSFLQRFQVEYSFMYSYVRRRFWQRYRYFHAFDRWLFIAQDSEPFNISCDQDCCNKTETKEEYTNDESSGLLDVGCGGEMLPHQKDGFLSVWIVTSNGQILCRLNVNRQNPEGSNWCNVKLPKYSKAISLSVGPLGNLIVCTTFGEIYFRENITWKNSLGTAWKSVDLPNDLFDKEKIIQISLSIYSIWARSSLNRLWLRNNVNLHENQSNTALGTNWTLIDIGIQFISSSSSGQLFALPENGTCILYKLAKCKNVVDKYFWTGKLPINFNCSVSMSAIKMVSICCSGLFLENDVLPVNWLQSPLISHKTYNKISDLRCDWRIKILSSLTARDNNEFKHPKFSNYLLSYGETCWSKASNCQIQCIYSENDRKIWFPGMIVLHHKVKSSGMYATLHVNTKAADLLNIHPTMFFIASNEVICISKYYENSSKVVNHQESCSTIVIFIKRKIFNPSLKENINVSKMLLKFSLETEAEDWIMAINFVSFAQGKGFKKSFLGKIWFLNQFHEPFYTAVKESDESLSPWQQEGGHFSVIESGAKGSITWALGFDGIAWSHTQGWGGSYLGSLYSSKQYLFSVTDVKKVYVIEYQKLKISSGEMQGRFVSYMWTNETGNIIRDKESLQLPSKRWEWCENWIIVIDKNVKDVDPEGWQYSTGIEKKFDHNLTWSKTIRRRTWSRSYKTSIIGPWKQIRNNRVKIIDLSIFPGLNYEEEKNHLILAVTDEHKLLVRKGVTLDYPEGRLWLHVEMNLKITSVSVNNNGTIWVVCTLGFIWRLKFTNLKDVTKINGKEWEVVKHPRDGRFISVSSGDNLSLWAVDSDYHLWMRTFDHDIHLSSVGKLWILVGDGITRVSCASHLLVWVVFSDGCVAERTGITKQSPQGSDWNMKLNGITTCVSICSA